MESRFDAHLLSPPTPSSITLPSCCPIICSSLKTCSVKTHILISIQVSNYLQAKLTVEHKGLPYLLLERTSGGSTLWVERVLFGASFGVGSFSIKAMALDFVCPVESLAAD